MSLSDVVIAGAGLAGIAAAVECAAAGARVELLETRPRLGGRATSFVDPRNGEALDNCQHVALGCCSAYVEFLEKIGQTDALHWTSEQTWIEPGGQRSLLRSGWLPGALHALPSFAGAGFLSLGEKLEVARGLMGLRLGCGRSATATFHETLVRLRQPARAVERFWRPVVVSACNAEPGVVASAVASQVFVEGMMAGAEAARIGVPAKPMEALYEDVPGLVARAGGRVRTGVSVREVHDGHVVLADGEEVRGVRVICALPFERALASASDEVRAHDARFAAMARLRHSPILGVHVWFDRPVLDVPHAVLVEGETHWLFRKDSSGRRVHAVISAADAWMGLDERAIVERVVADVRRYVPGAAGAGVEFARSVKEKRATFVASPEGEASRPGAEAAGRRLVLAGDYTRTGWPATMEGAVRSGVRAGGVVVG